MKAIMWIAAVILGVGFVGRISADSPPHSTAQLRPAESAVTLSHSSAPQRHATLRDGGFESGSPNPFWTESSTNFGSPICNSTCNMPARTGTHLAWFGGIDTAAEVGLLEQSFQVPSGVTSLTFWLMIGTSGGGTGQLDMLLDGRPVASFDQTDAVQYATYQPVTVPFSVENHTLRFEAATYPTGITNFFIDDVTLNSVPTAAHLRTLAATPTTHALTLLLIALTLTGVTLWKR